MTNKSPPKYQSTEDLIDSLSSNLPRVRVRSTLELTLQNLSALALLGGFFIALLKINDNIFIEFQDLSFSTTTSATVLGLLLGSFCLAKLSRPGQKLSKFTRVSLLFCVSMIFIIQVYRLLGSESMSALSLDNGWKCFALTCLVAVTANTALIFLIQQQAPVQRLQVSLTLLVLSMSLGSLILQFHCPNTQPLHELIWHILLPLSVLSGLTRIASRKTLNW